jgi:hypothetical protein
MLLQLGFSSNVLDKRWQPNTIQAPKMHPKTKPKTMRIQYKKNAKNAHQDYPKTTKAEPKLQSTNRTHNNHTTVVKDNA